MTERETTFVEAIKRFGKPMPVYVDCCDVYDQKRAAFPGDPKGFGLCPHYQDCLAGISHKVHNCPAGHPTTLLTTP